MEFYYEGKLVRTSKTHDYRFAIVNDDFSDKKDVWSCHGTLEAAQKEFRRPIAECETAIAEDQKIIEALQKGYTYVDLKICGRWHRISLKGKDFDGSDRSSVSTWEKQIESHKRRIEYLNTRRIVTLEQR